MVQQQQLRNVSRHLSPGDGRTALHEASPELAATTRAPRGHVPPRFHLVPQAFALIDVACIVTLSIMCGVVYSAAKIGHVGDVSRYFGFGVIVAVLFSIWAHGRGLYSKSHQRQVGFQIQAVTLAWTMVFLFLVMVGLALKISDGLPHGTVLLIFLTGLGGMVILRWSAERLLVYLTRSGALARRQVVVVTQSGRPISNSLAQAIEDTGGNICETILLPVMPSESALSESMLKLIDYVRRRCVDEILLATSWSDTTLIEKITEHLRVVPVPVKLAPDAIVSALLERPLVEFGDTKAVELRRAPLTRPQLAAKRLFDLVLVVLVLPLLLPTLAVIAALIFLDSPGPVLFRQRRTGFNGRLFQIYKFRTMKTLEDGEFIQQACQDDMRVTRVGRVLRTLSIDELPQLFNVLRGEMSLVGPRPHALAHDNEYGRFIALYAARHNVKPGITGWAQVNYLRGPTPHIHMMITRVEYDLWYINHWSFWLDTKILILTVLRVCSLKNAY
jgi:Undecaprenyl-phosphate glucose phosphotransferase